MSRTADRLPKYKELRLELESVLASLHPHDPVPSERDLMARHGVSRMTVRKALAGLEEDGLVERIQGAGTFVADPAKISKSLRLTSFSEDIASRRMVPGGRTLLRERTTAEASVAQDLALKPGAPVEHLERLRTADGSPMCLENAWLPADVLPHTSFTAKGESLYESLTANGHEPERAEQHIRATVLNPRDADLLGVPPFSAALIVSRITFDRSGRAIERAISIYRADRYDFKVTITRAITRGRQ